MMKKLSTGVVTTLMPAIADDPVKTLAFDKIQNVFIAIIAGIIGASCYNRFKNAKLPDWLAFFSGKRCVAIVTGLVSILVSVVLLFVWPIIFSALVAVGEGIIGMGGIGAGIYAFLNRLLIPTGLHHALNNVFWFDTIGLGDLSHYWAASRCMLFMQLCTAFSPSSPTMSASAQASASRQARPTSYSRPSCRQRTTR